VNRYSEDYLVEQPAIQLFEELGWTTISAMEETLGPSGTLGRETKSEVVLLPSLQLALERLNPLLPSDAIRSAIDELVRDRSSMFWLRRTGGLGSTAGQGVDSQLRSPILG
jgi:type I restriction enzyme R subunit